MQATSPAWRRWPRLLLVVLVLLVWGQSIAFQFVWDDKYFIQDLASIRSLASVPDMFYRLDAQSSYPEGFVLFRPLRTLHYAILFTLGGGETPKPALFHLANLAWHAAATLLLYNVLLLLLVKKEGSDDNDGRWVALLGAAAFAVHPVVSEVVCWAKSLDDAMAATFVLASCAALLRLEPDQFSRRAYLWAIAFFALALYSKESAVPFALFCIPIIAWKTRRAWMPTLRLSLPFFAVALVFLLHRHLVIGRTSQTAPLSGSYAQTLVDTVPAAPIYGRLLAGIPPFCIDYTYMKPGHALTSPTVLLGLVLILVVVAASALIFRRKLMLVGAGILWLLLFMLPFSNLVPMMQYCAERFLYLPLLGWIIALGAAVMLLRERRIALIAGTAVVICWAALAWNRSWIWRDPVTLFVRTHLEGPTSARVQDNAIAAVLGQPHVRAVFVPVQHPGRHTDLVVQPVDPNRPVDWPALDATLGQLRNLFPSNATVNGAFAISKALQGKAPEAIPYFELAAQQRPDDAQLWNNLGHAYRAAGQGDRAEDAYRRAGQLTRR
jgi:protein O-mannosyl-transferase